VDRTSSFLETEALRAADRPAASLFLLATDLDPQEPAWGEMESYARTVSAGCTPLLGFEPALWISRMDEMLPQKIAQAAGEGVSEIYVLPATLDLNLIEREGIGRLLSEARRSHPDLSIHHDDVDPCDPWLVDCLAGQAANALERAGVLPQRAGLVLAARGSGDASSRAESYCLMRLLWERLGLNGGEVGFLRHERPFLLSTLERCVQQAPAWVMVPQMQWRSEQFQYAEVILQDFQKSHPATREWRLADPPGNHPGMAAWLIRRITRLWTEKRERQRARLSSPKRAVAANWSSQAVGRGTIASIGSRSQMAGLLEELLGGRRPDRVLVKVTWHGYATGTYTDPAALDLLLGALPAKGVVLEGHTSSRNAGGAEFDWETQARENRAWIRQQDAEYLRRTGLAEVLSRHGAQYVNVTEAFWDEDCAPPEQLREILKQGGITLHCPDLIPYVPRILMENPGSPMISFAKFKGPTRLTISNLFGLLPQPLRSAWHGPNLTYVARVCCDLAKLYGAMFPLYGIAEALYSAVRWNRRGLYRSRWGNYDLVENAGYVTAGRELVSADILASRLQGQDVNRSAFFDVVRTELGWDDAAAIEPLPASVQRLFS
jgi:hypothetical protein